MAKSILDLLDQFEPEIEAAFLDAIQEIKSKVRLADLKKALERGDIDDAIDVLYIDGAAYAAFERALANTYAAGGAFSIDRLGTLRDTSGDRFVVRFDVRNYRAENWLRTHSSSLITRVVDEQKRAVRNYLVDGLTLGNNPNITALDVVGRLDPVTKRRNGGVLGLSETQEIAVRNARQELQNGRYSEYRTRARRDKRFDSVLAKAAVEKRALTKDEIDKMLGRYSDGLLKLRGQTIARTESLAALNAAQHESLKQVVETGKIRADQIVREWDATMDRRTRTDHAAAEGQKTTLDGSFYVGGRLMKYPGDPAGGPGNVINCRCVVKTSINYFAGVS